MFFNSPLFFLFLGVVLLLYQLPFPWSAKKVLLLAASYSFYASFYPPYLLLLLAATVVDFAVATRMAASTSRRARRAWLLFSLLSNLGMLAAFKYVGFFIGNLNDLLGLSGTAGALPVFSPMLPIGISFFTFEAISYTVDVYRGAMRPTRSLLDYALFISFFPRMVAGPIMRAGTFLPQCEGPRRSTSSGVGFGLFLVALGMFEKVALADSVFARAADMVFSAPAGLSARDAWIGSLAFTGQIFCDFAGYSTCAIGIALCFGFELPPNFNAPYAALGFSDFWRRWHISLSTWLRDYLYIPLGGNRHGRLRAARNVMLTMLLGGLWHGASWTFVLWGLIHGALLVAQRGIPERFTAAPGPALRALGVIATLLCINVTWIFFRAETVGGAVHMTRSLLGHAGASQIISPTTGTIVLIAVAGVFVSQWLTSRDTIAGLLGRCPVAVRVACAVVLLFTAILGTGGHAFLYFRF